MSAEAVKKQTIDFGNNKATAIIATAADKTEDIVAALAPGSYSSVILVMGGADSLEKKMKDKLTQLFSRGIARGVAEAGGVVIDGGTQSGIMELMGEAVVARGNRSQLIGVAPAALVSYPGASAKGTALDPNHTHFVLTEGSAWGSETSTMFRLAKALSAKTTEAVAESGTAKKSSGKSSSLPMVAILAGGGEVTRNEVLRAVRQNMRIIVVEESGGLSDELATAWKNKSSLPDDPELAEIISEGDLHFHLLSSPVKGIERLIIRELGVDKVLLQAWETFAVYDFNADLQQKRFNLLQIIILLLGVSGTLLVVLQQIWAPKDANTSSNIMASSDLYKLWRSSPAYSSYIWWWMLHNTLIIIPILLTVLVTAANRFKQGSKWLLLRAGAESIKREIFRYRTRAMYYKEKPEQQLAERVEDITRRTMRTEVNSSSLRPYDTGKGAPPAMYVTEGTDDGIAFLVPDKYIEVRLNDQLDFFRRKAVVLEKQLNVLYWLTFIIGGAGSFLAAVNLQVWVALTTSLAGACLTFLGYKQTEHTLMKYNQAGTDLANVKAWWNALSADEQASQTNIDSLVSHTEQVLQSELDGWIQQMQNSLAELREDQKKKYEDKNVNTNETAQVSVSAAPPVKAANPEDTATETDTPGGAETDPAEVNEDQKDGEADQADTVADEKADSVSAVDEPAGTDEETADETSNDATTVDGKPADESSATTAAPIGEIEEPRGDEAASSPKKT